MNLNRREFIHIMSLATAAGLLPAARGQELSLSDDFYTIPSFGNARLLHFTDCHAQLNPIYFREPNVNIGLGDAYGRLPHIVGNQLLSKLGFDTGSAKAHAFSYLDFTEAAQRLGKIGGFAHLKTLINQLRGEVGDGKSLLLDGGDTWQGSGTAYWTRGQDMVKACNLLGVDIMTGHWEYTYLEEEVHQNIELFNGEFVAQNVKVKEDALFEGVEAYDDFTAHAFKPYTMKEMGDKRVAIIGQSFPYTPIANPSRFIPNWTFGIRDEEMQSIVEQVRDEESPDAVIVLSHNGMDVDIKMAEQVSGIDAILGGHTHDGMPVPVIAENAGGKTIVTNAGSNGKFLAVLDLDLGKGKVNDYRYQLLPVFSNYIDADPEMTNLITEIRAPYLDTLTEELAETDTLLYRRGNFNGTFDQVICNALNNVLDSQISLSPGFRWGTSVLPGAKITMDNVLDQTCITYPETYVREMKGEEIKLILEDVADNLFNEDPYYQQGGDMVRCGGLDYTFEPKQTIGNRVSNMQLDDGTLIEAGKSYKVSGWATVGSQAPGAPIWEVVAEYLRDQKTIKLDKINTPKLIGVDGNPGLENYDSPLAS